MFFKNRTERDIDEFKAMRDAASRIAKAKENSDERQVSMNESIAGQQVAKLPDETIDRIIEELTSGAGDHHQSVVSANATWEGKLKTEGSAWIEGKISGEIEAGETVFIAKGAEVHANVNARRVIVGGDMEGQITCREQLVVEQSGRLGGKVSTRTLVVEEGAVVHSQIHMQRGKELAQPKEAVALPPRDPVAIGAISVSQRPKAGQVLDYGSRALEQDREE